LKLDSLISRRMFRLVSITLLLLVLPLAFFGQETRQGQVPTAPRRPDILRKFPLTKFYDTPTPLPPGKPGELIRSVPFDSYVLPSGVEAVRILYYSRTHAGELVASSGVVLYPDGKSPTGGWPVLVWAHELNGVARTCAPSLSRNLQHGPFLAMYVNLGYAVVATDYTGLGTNFRNAFADVRSNAQDTIYSVQAARSAVPSLGSRWVAMGVDEGATAVVRVAELERQTRDTSYLGAIAISRLSDLEDLLTPSANQSHQLPLLLAYGVKTISPQFDPKDILSDQALTLYGQLSERCSVPVAEKVPVTDIVKAHWLDNRFVQDFLQHNRLGTQPAEGPLMIVTSEGDPTFGATTKVVMRLCKQGDKVLFNRYGENDPGAVVGDSTRDQISWIQNRFAGRPASANCPAQP
jgi:Secretory lipase